MDNFFESIVTALQPDTRLFGLSAIHLPQQIRISTGLTRKLEEGQFVFIEDGKLKDCFQKPNYRITSLRGKLDDSYFEFTAINLKTLELVNIVL